MAVSIKKLDTESQDRLGDIVFIHGLSGDGVTTWQSDASSMASQKVTVRAVDRYQ